MYPFLDHPLPLAIAHRGGSRDIENTMASFAHAVRLGYRYLETDVRLTADGHLVAFHDTTLDRVLGAAGRVRELTWSQLERFRVGGREPVARFGDLLETWPDVRLVVDPKCDEAVDPLIAALSRHDAVDRVCVGSFSDQRLARFRRAFGGALCTSMGPRELLRLRLAAWRLAPESVVPAAAACAQMPVRHGPIVLAEPRCIDYAHARGLQVHVWTINDPAEMRRLLDLGVDAIITDEIAGLRAVLMQRGQWHGG